MFYIRVLDSYTLVLILLVHFLSALELRLLLLFIASMSVLRLSFSSFQTTVFSVQNIVCESLMLFFPCTFLFLLPALFFFHSCLIFLLFIVGNEGLLTFLKVMLGCFFPPSPVLFFFWMLSRSSFLCCRTFSSCGHRLVYFELFFA